MPTNALHEMFTAARVLPVPSFLARVNALITQYPPCLMEKDDYGHTPLLCALVLGDRVPMEVILALIDACPDAILECNDDGNLPIQYLLRDDGRRLEMARALINANPAGLKMQDCFGDLTLHAVVENEDVDVETFNLILQGYPEACKVKDLMGRIPLEISLRESVIFSVVEALVRAFPDSLKIEDSYIRYPFHEICSNYLSDMTEEFIFFVKDNYPEVFLLPNGDGYLPLHCVMKPHDGAAGFTAALAVILAVVRACPEAARVPEGKGQLPLHIAVGGTSASLEVVRALYGTWHDSVNQRDSGGRIPLAHAVVSDAPQAVVELLLRACPESAKSKDHQGMTPLHHAYRSSVGTAAVLIEAWPDGLQEPDTLGNIPLLLAMFESTYFNNNVATLLLEAWPDSIRRSNTDGNLVIHEFSRTTAPDLISSRSDAVARARFMIDAWPESLLQRNRKGELPLHVLLGHMGKVETISGQKRLRPEELANRQLEMVGLFVDNCRESVEMTDADGDIPLITACDNDSVSLDVIQLLMKACMNILLSSYRRQTASLTEES